MSDDVKALREKFESLTQVADLLNTVSFNEQFGTYHAAMVNSATSVKFVQGAWYAFQEQQRKIDAVLELIDSEELGHDARLGDFYRDIEEILK